ncbi:Regulator of RNase E activity RraA [Geodermatophilus africanus]|uniref:Putative 4-hydroxy-4-methyl-2-oxoglutarate aldolase n=1 Tax=Geodermatophilus africanus TaxID=1137993 RepID=A0A1H3AH24_9ACTN|nr:dimethylmenaquinone methyltransferase [Geodermatophilus africanus]SDX28761.1 Regulator of RNase E activity RraA [Geodermatophilus africanus]
MSRGHAQQWTVVEAIERPPAEVVAALAGFATTQIADCGGPVGVVGPGIGRIAGGAEFCGPAVTVWTKPGDILFVLKMPDVTRPGDVVAVDGGGRADAAVLGDIISGALVRGGVVGVVVDGAVRDVEGIDEVGLPTFARGTHPATGSNEGPGAINVPVQVGGVVVHPGDVVRGDASGVVVVPREHLDTVIAMARTVEQREVAWRQAVADGVSIAAATGADAVIAERRNAAATHLP